MQLLTIEMRKIDSIPHPANLATAFSLNSTILALLQPVFLSIESWLPSVNFIPMVSYATTKISMA